MEPSQVRWKPRWNLLELPIDRDRAPISGDRPAGDGKMSIDDERLVLIFIEDPRRRRPSFFIERLSPASPKKSAGH